MDARLDRLPVIDGEPDARYLAGALRRAGRSASVDDLEARALTGGRQSNTVLSLKSRSAGAYVLKAFPRTSWRDAIFAAGQVEPALWTTGVTRELPPPLRCPTIDLAHHATRDETWMLMADVSDGIMGRGIYDAERLRWLFGALAALHARYWDERETLAALPLVPLDASLAYFAQAVAAVGGRVPIAGWVKDVIDNVSIFKPLVPVFLDALGSADADFYLGVCERHSDLAAALAQLPQTLCHGDVRRANVAPLGPDNVSIFDWDLASCAPAASDLTWYWFLHVWCYPPADGLDIADREPLRAFYIERLSALLGSRFDRATFARAWDLCWLKVFAQLGFCLVDPLTGAHGPDDVTRVRRTMQRALEEAKRIRDKHLR